MTTETFDATVDTILGEKLPETLKFKVSVDLFDTFDEMVAAKAELSPKEQLKARNTQLRNKARAAEQEKAIEKAGIVKPTLKTSEEMRIKKFVEVYVALGHSDEDAREMAVEALKAAAIKAAQSEIEASENV